jgi:hypothetical protein
LNLNLNLKWILKTKRERKGKEKYKRRREKCVVGPTTCHSGQTECSPSTQPNTSLPPSTRETLSCGSRLQSHRFARASRVLAVAGVPHVIPLPRRRNHLAQPTPRFSLLLATPATRAVLHKALSRPLSHRNQMPRPSQPRTECHRSRRSQEPEGG